MTCHEDHVGKHYGAQEAEDRSKAEPKLEPLLGFPRKRQSRPGKTVQGLAGLNNFCEL